VFQVALELGDPGEDLGLASLQDEARQALPRVHLVDRMVAIATRPDKVELHQHGGPEMGGRWVLNGSVF
jgi:hypothetical protein